MNIILIILLFLLMIYIDIKNYKIKQNVILTFKTYCFKIITVIN